MLSMESLVGARGLGEESLQMWDLNKRLEAYLARVKFLEEENEVLRAEIQNAKGSPSEDSWRSKYEEELRALRTALDDAFREKWSAELARDNLYEEIQYVKSRCQKEQAAREEAKKLLSASKKELEEEQRAQIWLKERALHLEKEVEALLEMHEEEKAGLDHELASFSQSLESFRCVPVAFQPVEVEDYSKRLSEIWKGAVETYKTEVSQLESSLCQAKENLWKAVEDNQQSQMQLQHLEKELVGLKARKDLLEESLSRQWQEQRGEAEKFQLALEALEQEKQALRVQIAQVLEDRQQLMHLKMSLSLEVATYRTLLEAESTRLQMPTSEYKLANGLRGKREATSETHGQAQSPSAARSRPGIDRARYICSFASQERPRELVVPKLNAKLEMKLQPVTPESRRVLSWDLCVSPSIFPRAEAKLAKTQSDVPKAPTPKTKSPITREFQKINSVLQAPVLKAAGTAARSAPSLGTPSGVLPSARPCSREPPESPGPEPKEGDKEPCEEPQDPSEEPPGKSPTPQLLYPDRLVTEALEDALKEVREDAQPQEEPVCEAERATEGFGVASEPEVPSWSSHPMEEVDGAKDTDLEALLEERTGEDMQEEAGVESTAWQDGATSHELGPSDEQDQGTPELLAAAPSERETQKEMRPWEEKASQEEETLASRSPEESGESEFACGDAESLPGKETHEHLSNSWEGREGLPKPGAVARGDLEEPEQGDEDGGAVSMEALDLLEDEERPWSPSKEEEESDILEEVKEEREEESLQEEIQATHACPMEAYPVLAGEDHPGDDLVEREPESLEQRDMHLCGADPAADEEGMEEMCPEHEPSSIKESTWEEEASPMPVEDTIREEATDGQGERGEPEEEAVEEEELEAEGKTLAAGELRQEEGTVEESVDIQENSFDDDMVEQEDLEALPKEEDLGGGDEWNPELMKEAQEGHHDETIQVSRDEELPMAPEIPWEARAEDAEEELALEPDGTEKVASQQDEDVDGDESQEEDAWRREELGQEPGMCKSIRLEDTLPDNTPLHLYKGDMVAMTAPELNPLAAEDATEPAPGPEMVLEDEGEVEGSNMPTSPLKDSHEEGTAAMEAASAAEHGEEEEGYFMVSAPIQEGSSLEDGEISEDFEEIKVGAVEGIRDDVQAPKEAPLAPEEEEHFEALASEADESTKVPPEEGEMPKAGDFANEMEEAMEEPLGEGLLVGSSDELEQDMENPAVEPGMHEGQGASEEDGGAGELESEAGRALEPPSSGSSGQLGTQEPILQQEDAAGATELVPPQGLPAPQPSGEEIPESGSLSLAEERCSDANPPPETEADDRGHNEPGQDGGAGANCDAEGLDLPGKLPPEDVMKASDILEIVEQALEFNQELMLAARPAEAEQQVPGSIPAEKQEQNGLPSEASLEDVEFPPELPNGIGETQPPACQEHTEPKATSAAPPEEPAQGGGAVDNPTPSLLLAKLAGTESAASTRGTEELGQQQDQLRDEQELWSEEDE
ncbi:PREDICTED: nestin [Tinamus guttatus]|nr:PREDICTED: nestin [Tinamus guttatus]